MHTVFHENLTTTTAPLFQAFGHELCPRIPDTAPAGNTNWEHESADGVGVRHYSKIASICGLSISAADRCDQNL